MTVIQIFLPENGNLNVPDRFFRIIEVPFKVVLKDNVYFSWCKRTQPNRTHSGARGHRTENFITAHKRT